MFSDVHDPKSNRTEMHVGCIIDFSNHEFLQHSPQLFFPLSYGFRFCKCLDAKASLGCDAKVCGIAFQWLFARKSLLPLEANAMT